VAADFFTVEVWTRRGRQRFIVLFVIELSTRKVEIAGIAGDANGLWMSQIGRNLTDAVNGILNGKRYLIHDRDPLFTTEFLEMLADVGPLPYRAQSPGLGQPTDQPTGTIQRGRAWAACCATAIAPRLEPAFQLIRPKRGRTRSYHGGYVQG
jgi:hypothetical protein